MPKIKLPNKKKSKVNAVSAGTVDPVHEIPSVSGEETINLSHLSGWDEISVQKQRYLVEYSKSKLKKKRAALTTGVGTDVLNEWLHEDPLFIRLFNDIADIHVEGVEEADYLFSYSSDGSRGRFLKNRSKHYQDEKTEQPSQPRIGTQNNQTNILAVLNSDDVQSKGLAGVAKAFGNLKNKDELPAIGDGE